MSEHVWITGASYGIGAALARRLAADGANVAVSARSRDKLKALKQESSGSISSHPLDVTDPEAVSRVIDEVDQEGPIDIAVLNAGSHKPVSARNFKTDELRELFELNVFGVANCLEQLMPRMIKRRQGRIAVVASLAGYRGLPTASYYGASKAALINMVESLRFDLSRKGVIMQLIDPGFVRTPLTDKNDFEMPFLVEPEFAAEKIVKGLRSNRFEIAFPTTFVAIMKLLRCLPYSLYFPLMSRGTKR